MNKDKQIHIASLIFSILVHGGLFVQFTRMAMGSQAQAPNYETRISLNLLAPVKQSQQPVEQPAEFKPIRPEKPAKKRVIKEKKMVQPTPEQVVAPKLDDEVQRQQADHSVPLREQYLARLLTHIEGYKHYPRSARRRSIEGSIQISFRLLGNGNITGLIASGGPLILRRAAKGSVRQALPLPACPEEVNCPLQVSYAMQFRLN